MAERPNQTDPMFPTLHGTQIDHLASFVPPKRASQREILFDQGDATHGVFVVVSGSIEILGVSSGNETVVNDYRLKPVELGSD